jgi:hypothetical protein
MGGRGKLRDAHRPTSVQGDMVGFLQGISGIPDFLMTAGHHDERRRKTVDGCLPAIGVLMRCFIGGQFYLFDKKIRLNYGTVCEWAKSPDTVTAFVVHVQRMDASISMDR